MKRLIIFCIFCSMFMTACGAARVPMSAMKQHDMGSMKPVTGEATLSDWKEPKTPQANEDIPISIIIKDKNNKLIKEFETVNEKKLHLVIVSKDLSYFSHIHPTLKDNGEFEIMTKFPKGGDYKMIAEMTPKGASEYSIEDHWIHVDGEQSNEPAIAPETELTKVIDGKKIKLSFDNKLKAKKNINMTFSLSDANTNKPVTNIEPYLGSSGHAVAIDKDVDQFLHIHPLYSKGKGPDITFMTYFPKEGIYRVWGQFNIDGHILTVPFTIKVS
ncbi:hypothetical protein ACQKCU_05670 [Heyndrickxia sporothermodurans]